MIDLDAYFARIGYSGPRAPTLDVLRSLQALHPAAIPYEAIDVLLGKPVDIAPAAIFDKLVRRRRGGYCFEHNCLFKAVLTTLGYPIEAYRGRVMWFIGPQDPLPLRTHMLLCVTIDGVNWLADVGFGGGTMTAPLRLHDHAPQATPGGVYRLLPIGRELQLEIKSPSRWIPMSRFAPDPQLDVDFIAPNWYTSKHPGAAFRKRLLASRALPDVRYSLLDNRLTIRPPSGEWEERELDRAGLETALRSLFDIEMTDEVRAAVDRVVWSQQGGSGQTQRDWHGTTSEQV